MPDGFSRTLDSDNITGDSPRLALIGCGAIAEHYYLPALANHPSVMENLILVDRNETRLNEISKKFNANRKVLNYLQIVDEVDGVILALPTDLHFPVGMEFLGRGIHILCEKPLAEVAHRAKLMVLTAKNTGAELATNYLQRRIPSFAKVKEYISNRTFGKPLHIRYTIGEKFGWPTVSGFYFRSDNSARGVLRDRGAHAIDHICWWLGDQPDLISSKNDAFGGSDATARVRFQHGQCFGELNLNWLVTIPCTFSIKCENAVIRGDVYDYQRLEVIEGKKKKQYILDSSIQNKSDIADEIVTNFISVVKDGEKPLISGAEVLDSVEFIDECYQNTVSLEMPWYDFVEENND